MVLRNTWVKLTHPEYWPTWVIYFQSFFYVAFHTLRLGNRFYPVIINPAITVHGGFAGVSKIELEKLFPKKYQPFSAVWNPVENVKCFVDALEGKLEYPCFVKPVDLFRGIGVEKLVSKSALMNYLLEKSQPVLIQQCIDFPLEFGVFIARIPGKRLYIPGLTGKELLSITGDGKTTIGTILQSNQRYRMCRKHIDPLWKERWNEIPKKGEYILVQPVGNHNKGTLFRDDTRLVTKKMEDFFESIVPEGIHYGRFDVKAQSLESLETGEGLYIIEFNGTIAEPVNYLDASYSYKQAQKVIRMHFQIQRQIGECMLLKGFKAPGLFAGINIIRNGNKFERHKTLSFHQKSIQNVASCTIKK